MRHIFGFSGVTLLFRCLIALPTFAQVQAVGDVSFAVPVGWNYSAAANGGAMVYKEGTQFWIIVVAAASPSSGNADADFKAAWQQVVLAEPGYKGVPRYSPYKITETVGYPGNYYDDSNADHTTYTRLYVLETGKSYIPVAFISANRGMLDGMEYIARAIVGSVRLAPLKASPIQNTITVSDLAGQWTNGIVTNTAYYNSAGQYQSNSLTAVRYSYIISTNGSYSYKFGGLMNNRPTNDDDSGVVQLGGAFLTFKGQKHTRQYRFMNAQQTLDGSTVITLFPAVDMSQINPSRDSEYLTRSAK